MPASSATSQNPAPRLATVDWGTAQNLTAMGVPPVAVAQIQNYQTWVGGPPLPADTREMGLRSQPNMEMLAQLDLDCILITRMYARQKAKLSQVAPVTSLNVYFKKGDIWRNTVAAVQKLGRIAHRPDAARQLIAQTKKQISRAAARVPADTPPLLIVQFVDARHVRVYGDGSLVQAALERMGLSNAWHGETTRWGTATVSLARLADIQRGRVVVMKPIPVGVVGKIAESRLWSSLPVTQNAPVVDMPAVWSFGGLPSASRFARSLADTLNHGADDGAGWPANAGHRP
ncbi:ABC transporter substrate-binding protein [Salinisphaera sp. USBA-960]|uniref:ABC transporter substrate-binding protein n=1 Tax=Salinisphaera orenii TaxID=856731 RepID=UPI0013A61221|nr:ABC transporter substrate-binding protein [Salifodinibacter halophilus]NNC25621.1 ABC transporter substrate-binding protein [Salifodinibacter halophilus]